MFTLICGVLLILVGGLAHRDTLIKQQEGLKELIHHLSIYKSSIGVMNLIVGLFTLIHSIFTCTTHTYTPLYWFFYTLSAYLAFVLGLLLSFEYLQPFLMQSPQKIHHLCVHMQLWTQERVSGYAWCAMALGLWKTFDAFVGV